MREFAPSMPERTGVKALVKWFNPTKGFGFVQFDDGSPDAFLHVSVIERLGHSDLPEGTEVICDLAQGRKGLQVHQITSIEHLPESRPGGGFGGGGGYDGGGYGGGGGFYGDRPRRPAPPPAGPPVEGTVKFFNAEKGFGFVVPDDGTQDIFVSARTLQSSGLAVLEPDQRVRVTTRMGQKGPMAATLELA
ncbi:MAG: cold-shock protein [Kiloniellales bacterium]